MSVVISLFVRLILSAVRLSQAATSTVRPSDKHSSVIGSVHSSVMCVCVCVCEQLELLLLYLCHIYIDSCNMLL
jgi:hypothetical protein